MSVYDRHPVEDVGPCLVYIRDDSIYLVSQQPDDSIANHRDSPWIGGCERYRRCHPARTRTRSHRRPDIHTTELDSSPHQIDTVTYGEPPDRPAPPR